MSTTIQLVKSLATSEEVLNKFDENTRDKLQSLAQELISIEANLLIALDLIQKEPNFFDSNVSGFRIGAYVRKAYMIVSGKNLGGTVNAEEIN